MSRKINENLKADYLHWLNLQLKDEYANPGKTYEELVNLMFEKEFVYVEAIPMDYNRLVDGLDLRVEFARANRMRPDALRNLDTCSFLEVLIGLSRRLAFTAGGQSPGWAWQLMCNLELHRLSDPLTRPKQRKAEEIMDMAMHRTYSPDGTGGFFPLAWPETDQTTVELWYQMNSYIEELHPEH